MKDILIKTDLNSLIRYRILVSEIYPHILIMTTSVELPARRHVNVYMCCDQYTLRKKISGTCFFFFFFFFFCLFVCLFFYLLAFRSTALIRGNSLGI